ncbi:MAG: endonuclease MutS2 [candidate division KSB1 bacterium]|nr:endonuclease MutS2 [candidate division KSB1 bacterium]
MESVVETLEFDHIRRHLAELATMVQGREKAEALLPLKEKQCIDTALDQTSELCDIIKYDKEPPIEGIPDISGILKRAAVEGSLLKEEECVKVAQCVLSSRKITGFFKSRQEKIPTLGKVTNTLIDLSDVEREISRCIDLSTIAVRDNASPELSAIRHEINRARASARKKIESMMSKLAQQGALQENVVAVRNGRHVLVIKEEYKRKVKGLIHDRSASGSSLFIEPLGVLEDNNRIRDLEIREKDEIEKILYKLSYQIHAVHDELGSNVETLGILDFIYAKARLSIKMQANPPEISENPVIHIAQGRHPLLLLRMGSKKVVPMDINLGEQFNTVIISGPNAGGKTVSLKTLGLLTIMALSGLHIPALPHSKIGIMTQIFASIGDEQSLDQDLSTFSSHLTHLKNIALHADKQHLVLIDEIGSGTDPEEGTSLAIALLEHLTQRGALSVVTTHQSPLKAFAYQTEGVENASLEFDAQTLTSTFHFRMGIPGSSYAFEIAERMHLPGSFIDRARELVGATKDKLEGLILDLENTIQDYKKTTREAELREKEYKEQLQLYKERAETLESEKNRLKKQAAREAEKILEDSNSAIEQAIREIRETQAEREAIRSAKQRIDQQKQKIADLQEKVSTSEPPEQTGNVSPGDYARWIKTGGFGTVVSEPDKKNQVMLQTDGGIKIHVPVNELVRKGKSKQKKSRVRYNLQDTNFKHELDLRGMRVEEALDVLGKFLDEAVMSGLSQVSIIHGKGTGKLREGILPYLDEHPGVQSHRLGNWNEGDSGVTVIKLKKG